MGEEEKATIDFTQGREFLELIHPGKKDVYFRCLRDDSVQDVGGAKAKFLVGDREKLLKKISKFNQPGREEGRQWNAYLYIQDLSEESKKLIEESGGRKGPKNNHVTDVRWLVAELDGPLERADLRKVINTMPPTAIVESSPGRAHVYWKLAEPEIEYYSDFRNYRYIQTVIASAWRELGADFNVTYPTVALRVPGLYRHKGGESHLSRLLYTRPEALFNPEWIPEERAESLYQWAVENIKGVGGSTEQYELDEESGGYIGVAKDRNNTLHSYVYNELLLKRDYLYEHAREVALKENKKNKPPLADAEVINLVKSAWNNYSERKKESGIPATAKVTKVLDVEEAFEHLDPDQDYALEYDNSGEEFAVPTSEASIVSRLVQRYGEKVKVNKSRGKVTWYVLQNGVWSTNSGLTESYVDSIISQVIIGMAREVRVANCFFDDKHHSAHEKLLKFIATTNIQTKRKTIKEALSNRSAILCSMDEFEAERDKELLACENGLINLATGEFVDERTPHRLLTRLQVPYKPEAECPMFIDFLKGTQEGDMDAVRYIQQVMGYALSGSNSMQCFYVVFGLPGTGKSTFTNILRWLCGDYWGVMRKEVIAERSVFGNENANLSSLTQCLYSRAVGVDEVGESDKWNETLLKSITGNDPITTKGMRQDTFSFVARFKMFMLANSLPKNENADEALWNRLELITFMKQFRHTGEEILDLDTKIWEAEKEGILAWAVRGYIEGAAKGRIKPCKKFANSKLICRGNIESFRVFLQDNMQKCEHQEGMTLAEIVSHYTAWCEIEMKEQMNTKQVSKILEFLGYTKKQIRGGVSRGRYYDVRVTHMGEFE